VRNQQDTCPNLLFSARSYFPIPENQRAHSFIIVMTGANTAGSAKAFLLRPILLPLVDLVGMTRQTAVTAYIFGNGLSNLAYPTNPVLLICLGIGVAIHYGPF
jgi:uncharacterized ion transporter superfamily protein YfcC